MKRPEPLKPEILRAIRERLCLTQAQLAARLGVSRISYSKWENGQLAKGIPQWVPEKLLAMLPPAKHDDVVVKPKVPDDAEARHIADLWGDDEV